MAATSRAPFPDASGLFKDQPAEAEYMASLVQRISAELTGRARDDAARASLLLLAPSGGVYAVYVSDAGVLSAVKVTG